jgi:hypothetical protein
VDEHKPKLNPNLAVEPGSLIFAVHRI